MSDLANMIGLKPCPFCGQIPLVAQTSKNIDGDESMILECCMRFEIKQKPYQWYQTIVGTKYKVKEDLTVIERWNTRVGDEHD